MVVVAEFVSEDQKKSVVGKSITLENVPMVLFALTASGVLVVLSYLLLAMMTKTVFGDLTKRCQNNDKDMFYII